MEHCSHHKRCVKEALQQAEAICEEKGVRFTGLRQQVLKLVWESHKPAKAYDILDKLKEEGTAKPPTVYRALDFLLEHGMVHKLNSLNAFVGCSHPKHRHECYFLICTRCGDASECCNDVLSKAIEATAKKDAFRLQRVTVEMAGVCATCAGEA